MNQSVIIKQDFLSSEIFEELNNISKNFVQNNLEDIYKNKDWKNTIKEDNNLPVCMYDLPNNQFSYELIKEVSYKTNFKPPFFKIRLHFSLPNSHIPWHIDNHKTGITIFLNNDWDLDHGGLFLYKDRDNNDNIKAILPEKNKVVIVRNGITPHAVSILSNNSKIRRTLQIFIDNSTINSSFVYPQSNNIVFSKKNYNTFLYNLIHVSDIELPVELCNQLIDAFNNNTELQYDGGMISGVNHSYKRTKDLQIPKNTPEWGKYEKLISSYLQKAVKKYIKLYNHFITGKEELYVPHFQIQKYEKNKGHFNGYHHDFFIDKEIASFRVITFIIYLNNISTGGETEFMNEIKIIPTAGRIVLFPAAWPYIHKGHIPVSDDKYIVTSWFVSFENH